MRNPEGGKQNNIDLKNQQNLPGGNPFGIPNLSSVFPNIPDFNDVALTDNNDLVGLQANVTADSKIKNLNVNELERLTLGADKLGYDLSDEDFARRFPLLVKGRDYNINSAASNLAGERDPFLMQSLNDAGLGDVDFGTGEFKQARNLGMPILAKEARDRAYFQRLLADNPQRTFGLNSGDVARIALANTQGANMLGLGQAQGRINQAIANTASDAASQAAMISALGQIAGAGVKAFGSTNFGSGSSSSVSPTLSANFYDEPGATAFSTQMPAGTYSGENFGYGDPYSGNFYDSSGNYLGNSFTGEGL
jgi:hypothetical protein